MVNALQHAQLQQIVNKWLGVWISVLLKLVMPSMPQQVVDIGTVCSCMYVEILNTAVLKVPSSFIAPEGLSSGLTIRVPGAAGWLILSVDESFLVCPQLDGSSVANPLVGLLRADM